MPDLLAILFLFAFGACVGSFLNVVVWRLPRDESLVTPPSHCPKCNRQLEWRDNIPIFGWIKLGGKCRYCSQPISIRYPLVELLTALLFVVYYVMFFVLQIGPCHTRPLALAEDWPMFGLYLFTVAALLAASLIDAELFIIPTSIPWLVAVVGIVVHTIIDRPSLPGALNVGAGAGALAAGGAVGLICSIVLWYFKVMPTSFPEGEPLLQHEREEMIAEIKQAKREGKTVEYHSVPPPYAKSLVRSEIRKEMLFLIPPMVLAAVWWLLTDRVGPLRDMWQTATSYDWITGLLGAVLGALVGGFVVWITRILGTIGFGKVAMGLGDVHLMFGVGAVIGAGAATVAFFLAPFFGIVIAIYLLLTGTRRELPYGPYLSLATAFVMLLYCPIAAWMTPGLQGLVFLLQSWFGMSGGDVGATPY